MYYLMPLTECDRRHAAAAPFPGAAAEEDARLALRAALLLMLFADGDEVSNIFLGAGDGGYSSDSGSPRPLPI